MAITRNPIQKDETQYTGVIKKSDPYQRTRRSAELATAELGYEKTGDYSALEKEASRVAGQPLGGSAEKVGLEAKVQGYGDTEYGRVVKEAQNAYKENPNEDTAAKLKTAMESGYQRYAPTSARGLDIESALRSLGINETSRTLADIQSNWEMDPEKYKDSYKEQLNKAISFYGAGSTQAVQLKEALRTVDEESLLYGIRSASLAYEKDPEGTYEQLVGARQKLIDFYGSSSDGYYASQALNKLEDAEQGRLDTQASTDFELGKISYEGYSSYLKATMSKYEEGSEEYMKYYKAEGQLTFNKQLDDLIRLQYSEPPGQVLTGLQSYQGTLQAGTPAYNSVQDSIDKMSQIIRQNAYNDMIKGVVKKRTDEINSLNAKLYILQRDYENGDMSDSKFKKKYKSYSNKLAYLSDPNTLPQYEIYNTYGTGT
jgi:hypothetical protein